MKFIFKNKVVRSQILIVSLGFIFFDSFAVVNKLEQITEERILTAKSDLQTKDRCYKALRCGVVLSVATVAVLTCATLFKKSKSFSAALSSDYMISDLDARVTRLETIKPDGFLLGMTKILGLNLIGSLIPTKAIISAFSRPNLKQTVLSELDIINCFESVSASLLSWQPEEYIKNNHHEKDANLIYARFLANQKNDYNLDAQEQFIIACNNLIDQIVYLIAHLRYMESDHNLHNLLIMNADRLETVACEFVLKVNAGLQDSSKKGIFGAVNLLKSSFKEIFQEILISDRQK